MNLKRDVKRAGFGFAERKLQEVSTKVHNFNLNLEDGTISVDPDRFMDFYKEVYNSPDSLRSDAMIRYVASVSPTQGDALNALRLRRLEKYGG